MLRFRDLGVFVFEFWVLRFRSRGLRFRHLGVFVFYLGVFVFECFVFEIWALRASVFVFESKPRMFCQESLGKIKLRTFPKRVGPRILSLENVDYLEQVNTSEWWKNKI